MPPVSVFPSNHGGTHHALSQPMRSKAAFKELDAWQQAMHVVERVYKATALFLARSCMA
jgi:hypothetical protein